MKKFILTLALALVLTCLLVVSASADVIVPSTSDAFGELTIFDEAIGNTAISQKKDNGEIARTVLFDGTNYYTVPTTYVLTESAKNRGDVSGQMFLLNFTEINGKLGVSFNKNSIIRIELPSDIAFICNGNENLSNCANVVEIILNDGLRFWDGGQRKAFTNCKKLKSIDASGLIIEYAGSTFALFEYCESLEYVKLPDAFFNGESYVNYDTDHMLSGCKVLKQVDNFDGFFKGVKSLGYKTFYNCWALSSINLWDGLENIEGRALGNCKAITSIVIPESVKTIGTTETVFEACTSLKTIVLPSQVTLGDFCFEKCTGLSAVWMPTKPSTFGKQVFGQCGNDLNVTFYFTTADTTVTFTNNQNNKDPFITALGKEADARIMYNTPASEKCVVFFGGHAMGEGDNVILSDYFANISVGCTCARVGCGEAVIKETYAPIFVDVGFSCTEAPIGGVYSASQFYEINKASYAKYNELTGTVLEYGFVVSASNNPLAEENKSLIAQGKTYITGSEFFNNAHSCYEIRVSGFKGGENGTLDNKLTFCMYVIDNGKVSYLNGGKTEAVVTQMSYTEVLNGK